MPSSTRRFIGRLAAILLVVLGSITAVILAWNHSPQVRNMRAIDAWIDSPAVQSSVQEFQKQSGLEFRLFTQTRQQGVLGVQVEGESTARHAEIRSFLESLSPPRPIEMNLRWPDGRFELIRADQETRPARQVEETTGMGRVAPSGH